MEDQDQESGSRASHGSEAAEPVRSRWTPKPEQILILESIFNSGMVNPPKDETVRIRKLLEKFGPVADANVFYWFQNRRSRSRRRQRQIQASLNAAAEPPQAQPLGGGSSGGVIQYEDSSGFVPNHPMSNYPMDASSGPVGPGSSSSFGLAGNDAATSDGFFTLSGHPIPAAGFQELQHNSLFGPPDTSNLHYQSGVITVFINGVATEVGRGPLDMKAMFGGEYVLYHSSGVAVEVNENGFLVQSLQHGESYFLVPRNS